MILIHRDCISNSSSILYAYLSYLLKMSRDACASKNKKTKEEIIVSLFDHQGHTNIPSKIQLVSLSLSCLIAASALGQNPNYNWPSQNLNIHNSRFAELDQINRDNVSRLYRILDLHARSTRQHHTGDTSRSRRNNVFTFCEYNVCP